MSGHTEVIGFGVIGRDAARHLLDQGLEPAELVGVDRSADAVERAMLLGAHAVLGDGTDRRVLAQAISEHTRRAVVAVVPDEAAVLITSPSPPGQPVRPWVAHCMTMFERTGKSRPIPYVQTCRRRQACPGRSPVPQ